MIGMIQAVTTAKSGKSLRVQIGGGWYSAKFDSGLTLADVGKNATVVLGDEPFPPGSTNYWINDYTLSGVGTGAPAVMQQTMATQNAPTAQTVTTGAYPSPPNKEALIGAMALVKATPSSDAEVTWANFVNFYNKLMAWNPNAVDVQTNGPTPTNPYDAGDITF